MTAPLEPLDRAAVVAGYRLNCAELEAALAAAAVSGLARRMYFPTRWDPFFKETMTLADVYAYPVAHFDFHAAQLSLDGAAGAAAATQK